MPHRSLPAFWSIAILVLGSAMPPAAQACACCSDPGQRSELTQNFDEYTRGELFNIQFSGTARLFSDPGFPESVEGVQDPLDQDYKLNVVRKPKEWAFEFVDAKGRTGTVLFPLPKRFTQFDVDPHGLAQPASPNGPSLYKEWRVHGLAKLGGILSKEGNWAHARLVFQGQGNSCTSAMSFESWTLSVLGKNIKFRFLGTTKR
ncbi:MAG: hypothetical protein ABL973_13055 [Micropepsaceae bacterium]